MLKDDLAEVAIELIKEFGSKGRLITKVSDFDPLTGMSGGTTESEIDYFYEMYGARELIDGEILSGDAKLYTYDEVLPDQYFQDNDDLIWHIVKNRVQKLWLQGKTVCYISQIRK